MARRTLPKPWQWEARGNDWYVTVREGKKRRQVYLAPANTDEERVKQLAALAIASSRAGTEGEQTALALIADRYLSYVKTNRARNTYRTRKSFLQSFLDYVAALGGAAFPVSGLRPFHITGWIDKHPEWAANNSRRIAMRS